MLPIVLIQTCFIADPLIREVIVVGGRLAPGEVIEVQTEPLERLTEFLDGLIISDTRP